MTSNTFGTTFKDGCCAQRRRTGDKFCFRKEICAYFWSTTPTGYGINCEDAAHGGKYASNAISQQHNDEKACGSAGCDAAKCCTALDSCAAISCTPNDSWAINCKNVGVWKNPACHADFGF